MSTQTTTKWHVASWPPLAWLETGIKLAALGVAITGAVNAIMEGGWMWPAGWPLAQFIVLGLLALGLLAGIYDRIQDRELIAMGFVILNNVGHWGLFLALATTRGPGGALPLFAGLMLAGDVVKLVFIRVNDFSVRDFPRSVLYGLTLFYVVGYALLLLFDRLIG